MIKFLKKFKDKILIALACSFIGIGTIFSNTLETKAYVSDEISYTMTFDKYESSTFYFNINTTYSNVFLNDYVFIFQLDNSLSYSGNLGSHYVRFYNNNYNYVWNETYNFYGNSSNTYIVYLNNYSNSLTFNKLSVQRFNSHMNDINLFVHYDFIPLTELSLYPYIDSYTSTLQNDYDTLLNEYNDYTSSHAYTNDQYNSLLNQNTSLTQQVQALQNQYDTYVSLHSYTNTQYETLLNNYNNLNQIYSDLQVSYTSLQSQYNALLNNYNYGIFGYLSWANFTNTATQQTIKKPNTQDDEFTLNDLITNGIIGQGGYFNMYLFENSSWNPNYNNIYADLYFYQSSVSGNLPTDLITISYNNNSSSIIEFLDTNGLSVTLNVDNYENGITGKDLYNANASFGAYVEEIHIKPNNAEQMGYYFTNSFYYQGYNTGYNYAYNRYKTQIDDLTQQVIDERNKNQVMYSNGYNEGFEARIILNLYME